MPVTPRGIWTPDDNDDWDLTVDLAAMANSIDDAVNDQVTSDHNGQSVANFAALPPTGNWSGRIITTSDTGNVYRWNGSWSLVWAPEQVGAVTPSGGATLAASASLVKQGNRVKLNLGINGASAFTSNTTIATLPTGFRPANEEWLAGASTSATAVQFRIATTGVVTIFFTTTPAPTNVFGQHEFII